MRTTIAAITIMIGMIITMITIMTGTIITMTMITKSRHGDFEGLNHAVGMRNVNRVWPSRDSTLSVPS